MSQESYTDYSSDYRGPPLVPFTTQITANPQPTQEGTQAGPAALCVYTINMSPESTDLMKECQKYLNEGTVKAHIATVKELDDFKDPVTLFIIPFCREDVIRKIQARFTKPNIITARAFLEARVHYRVHTPFRNLAISLAMYKCYVFLTKSCNDKSLKNKINGMCGNIVERFDDDRLNVVITDRGDDKYCSKASNRGVALVSKDWIEECYNNSLRDEREYFNLDASKTLPEHRIKPFFGLTFKINVPNSGPIKNLISSNQGKIIYGNESSLTHIVISRMDLDSNRRDQNPGPKIVDSQFLEACSNVGYYLSTQGYIDYIARKRSSEQVRIKQEILSQAPTKGSQASSRTQENYRSAQQSRASSAANSFTMNVCHKSNDSQAMLPPPLAPRQVKQTTNLTNGAIIKALSGIVNGTQTQMPSTQMGRLPDREICFEHSVEPSQQLYWQ